MAVDGDSGGRWTMEGEVRSDVTGGAWNGGGDGDVAVMVRGEMVGVEPASTISRSILEART